MTATLLSALCLVTACAAEPDDSATTSHSTDICVTPQWVDAAIFARTKLNEGSESCLTPIGYATITLHSDSPGYQATCVGTPTSGDGTSPFLRAGDDSSPFFRLMPKKTGPSTITATLAGQSTSMSASISVPCPDISTEHLVTLVVSSESDMLEVFEQDGPHPGYVPYWADHLCTAP
jgi:hypothetical protein